MARVTATNDPMNGKILTCERYARLAHIVSYMHAEVNTTVDM